MYSRNYWFGQELEGRLYGIQTLFIRNCFPSQDEMNKANFHHLYLTLEFLTANKADSQIWDKIRFFVFKLKMPLSIEANDSNIDNIPLDLYNVAHILYRIPDKTALKLKKHDTIVIQTSPYNCYCCTISSMIKTENNDYRFDTEEL